MTLLTLPLGYEIPPVVQVSAGSGLAPGDTREAALLVLEGRRLGAGDHHPTFTLAKKGGQLTLDCSDMEEGGPGANWTRHHPGQQAVFFVTMYQQTIFSSPFSWCRGARLVPDPS